MQFLKDNSSSERNILDKLDGVDIIKGKECEKFVFNMNDKEKECAAQYYRCMLNAAFENASEYDMLVLDEVMVAVQCGFIEEEELIGLLSKQETEIVMTGGTPSQRIMEICDYVTEMKKIKHPFDKGVTARKGVEF